jgi:hypothetical protein
MDPEHWFQESEDGHEMTFAVNVLAHHLLTHRLKVLTHIISALRNSTVVLRIRDPVPF